MYKVNWANCSQYFSIKTVSYSLTTHNPVKPVAKSVKMHLNVVIIVLFTASFVYKSDLLLYQPYSFQADLEVKCVKNNDCFKYFSQILLHYCSKVWGPLDGEDLKLTS